MGLSAPLPASLSMSRCEFCASPFDLEEAANLSLLGHVRESPACNQQYEFLLENLRASWTRNMSGG